MDDMFFTRDERSLRRGKRAATRTETCRPCIISAEAIGIVDVEAVVLDANPFGMLVRALDVFPVGSEIAIQLMRDDSFREPFSDPLGGHVVRIEEADGGFVDHGVKLVHASLAAPKPRPGFSPPRPWPVSKSSPPTRKHTFDVTVGDEPGDRLAR